MSKSAPWLPMLVMVNVPPDSSSGLRFPGACALRDVGDRACQPGQRQVAGVLDHRRQQALLGVDREAEMLGVVVGDLLAFLVVAGVDVRMDLQRVDHRAGDERQVRQVHPFALGEGVLRAGPQRHDLGHVDLVSLRQLRCGLQGFARLLRGDLPDPVGLLGGAAQMRQSRCGRRRLLGGGTGLRGGGRCGGLGSLLGLRRRQHVLLADPPADAGSLHRGEVNVVLRGEFPHQRGHIG